MNFETLKFPDGSIWCRRGDTILQRGEDQRVRAYLVEDLVKLSRLVPFGEDGLVEEQIILDSERPAYMEEIFLLLSVANQDFASLEEARRAVEAGALEFTTEWYCLNIRRFRRTNTQVFQPANGGQPHERVEPSV